MLKDKKVEETSIETLVDFWSTFHAGSLWNPKAKIEEGNLYGYVFTNDKLVYVRYEYVLRGMQWDSTPSLERIWYANRDGITEYNCINEKISTYEENIAELIEKRSKSKYTTKLTKEIISFETKLDLYKKLLSLLPEYKKKKLDEISFEDLIKKVEYTPVNEQIAKEYVVLDVETNGLRTASDDLLSISIYDPYKKVCYNRFLPTDLQPLVLTTSINGISDEGLHYSHLTQKEFNDIVDYFDLSNRKILVYYGGKRNFDLSFLTNYCKRHKIKGVDSLESVNIKELLPTPVFNKYKKGLLSKDNLCKAMGIEGVSSIHSGQNDCILEWQLFEKVYDKKLFFINWDIYEYSEEYIVPITYLIKSKELRDYVEFALPELKIDFDEVFSYEMPLEIVSKIKKFPTNITGIALENVMKFLLDAKEESTIDFLADNKKKIVKICSLDSQENEIPIVSLDNGELLSLDEMYDDYIDSVNEVSKVISDQLNDVIEFIRKEIFVDETINSQELVLSEENRVLSLCDFSSKSSILEMKTYFPMFNIDNVALQLFFQSKGRDIYLIAFEFNENFLTNEVKGLKVTIYKFDLSAS